MNPETSLLRKLEICSNFNIFTEKELVVIMQKMIIFRPPENEIDEDEDSSLDEDLLSDS